MNDTPSTNKRKFDFTLGCLGTTAVTTSLCLFIGGCLTAMDREATQKDIGRALMFLGVVAVISWIASGIAGISLRQGIKHLLKRWTE